MKDVQVMNYLGRFHALTEMMVEASELVLEEKSKDLGTYGKASIAHRNLEQLLEQANTALLDFKEESRNA